MWRLWASGIFPVSPFHILCLYSICLQMRSSWQGWGQCVHLAQVVQRSWESCRAHPELGSGTWWRLALGTGLALQNYPCQGSVCSRECFSMSSLLFSLDETLQVRSVSSWVLLEWVCTVWVLSIESAHEQPFKTAESKSDYPALLTHICSLVVHK